MFCDTPSLPTSLLPKPKDTRVDIPGILKVKKPGRKIKAQIQVLLRLSLGLDVPNSLQALNKLLHSRNGKFLDTLIVLKCVISKDQISL